MPPDPLGPGRGGGLACNVIPMPPDMYSFDVNEETAGETYDEVCSAYERIFKRLDLPIVKGNSRYCLNCYCK